MKRILVFLLGIVLNPSAFGTVHVRIPDVNGLPGTPVIIPVMVEDATQISTMFFSLLEFDSAVLTVASKDDLVKGDLLGDHSAGAGVKAGKVNVTIFSSSRASFRAASGTAAQVVADIDFGAGFGSSHNLTLANVAAYDSSGAELATQVTAGKLNITNQPNTPGADQNLAVFPQFVNGTFAGGRFQTQLMFVNFTNATSDVEISFARSGGVPWEIQMEGGQTASTLTLSVPPSGTRFLNSAGTGDLGAGTASLVATAPLEGRIVFELFDPSGKSITAAGVSASSLVNFFEIPIVYKAAVYDSGIALYNVNDSPVVVQLRVKEVDGDVLSTRTVTLHPYEHLPQFSRELFAAISALPEFQGSIEVTASLPIGAVALKQAGLVLTDHLRHHRSPAEVGSS